MESMRDTRRIMENEARKGGTPLIFEKLTIDADSYQEITSEDRLLEVLRYLHRVGGYKKLANKTVNNNIYTHNCGKCGKNSDFKRTRSIFDREKIYRQMIIREKRMNPTYYGDCFIETAKCHLSLPKDEWDSHKMRHRDNGTYGFILSDRYILCLYKFCREARLDFAFAHPQPYNGLPTAIGRLMSLKDVSVMAHCLLLDDVWEEDGFIVSNMYTIYKLD